MSKIIVLFEGSQLEFYNLELNKVEAIEKDDDLYVILPDDAFFFFQSDISSKRRVQRTIEAYAKTVFSTTSDVGFVRLFNPIVGYIVNDDKLSSLKENILEGATFITTPFLIYTYFYDNFVYVGNGICAAVSEGRLKFYMPGDENAAFERLTSNLEIVRYTKNDLLTKATQVIKSKSFRKISLSIGEKNKDGFENWKISRFAAIVFICLAFIVGEVLKYSTYSKELKKAHRNLNELYTKALGSTQYEDPFGVLLYKATYGQKNGSLSLTKLLYFLSKAKSGYGIKVNLISFSDGNLKIKGTIDSYKNLINYIKDLKKLIGKNIVIQNTSSKKNRLNFTLVCNEYG